MSGTLWERVNHWFANSNKMFLAFYILSKYFEGDIEKAEEANDFILNNREEVIKESITRKLN